MGNANRKIVTLRVDGLEYLVCPNCECNTFYFGSKMQIAYVGQEVYLEIRKTVVSCSECDTPMEIAEKGIRISVVQDLSKVVLKCEEIKPKSEIEE